MPSEKKWYIIDIVYVDRDNEVVTFRIPNMEGSKVQTFRENIFIAGAYRRIDDATGEIIPPYRICGVDIYRQAHFFKNPDDARFIGKEPVTKKPK